MKKLFTLFLFSIMASSLFAQKPEGEIMEASVAPVIDGVIDEVWSEANVYNIDKNAADNTPTLGDPGETTWKALWTKEGFYLLLQVTDNVYLPSWIGVGTNSWEYDKPEVYFDVNYELIDALGPSTANSGHYQVATEMTANNIDGTPATDGNGVITAFMVDDPNYIAEYFIPFAYLNDSEGAPVDLTAEIGFDVTIIDRDTEADAQQRAVWANTNGDDAASWVNMDDCGTILFNGAEPPVFVDEIILTGGDITEDKQTFAISTEVLPEDASSKIVVYKILEEGTTGRATIDANGVVTPILDGVIMVQALSSDGFIESEIVEINISGQNPTIESLNVIKNGEFKMVEESGQGTYWTPGWTDASPAHSIVEGVSVHTPVGADAVWNYQFSQVDLKAIPNVEYIYSFKAWADADRTFMTNFEDTPDNSYLRYGTTTDSRSADGRSEWVFDITTEPTVYTFDVTFDQIVETTVQKVSFMIGTEAITTYIDSIVLISVADLGLVGVNDVEANKESMSVYPNPATSKLHVDLSTLNSTVAIFNSLGVKIEETIVNGTHHIFDVSHYPQGLYFVKSNNTVVKFIR